ncbi:unnamed protein product, partial [Rotaria sordida]
ISQRVSELVTECAAQFGLLLDDISITEQSRQANVTAAEGDARTGDLIGKALDEAGDAAEGIANQLSKSRNSVYLPHGPQMLLNIIGAIQ